jgi:hypothetical protein
MRLSAWRTAAPRKEAATAKVAAVVDPILAAFGADPDPHCWVVWGEEPAVRFVILVPTEAGLIHCFVRVNVPQEGPRATTKLVRWNRVQIGELGLETQAGHRLLSFQVEQQVLRGVDAEADRVAAFALRVIAAIDGRPIPAVDDSERARSTSGARPCPGARASSAARRTSATTGAGTTSPRPSPGRGERGARG